MASPEPLISVIIPTYNREYIIKNAIKSVLEQTYTNIELLIIDDASTDNTETIVKSFKDNRIKYIKLIDNTKGKKTRNVGIKMSKGDYIAFLDSDDEWIPNKIEKQLKAITHEKLKNKEIMCFTGLLINNKGKYKKQINKYYQNEMNIIDYILVERNEVQTSSYMVSSSIAKKTLFNESLKKHQDWDFCIRLRKNNVTFVNIPECLTIWNVDKRADRISESYKNEEISLDWLNKNSDYFSKKAQYAFKVIMLSDNLIYKKRYFEVVKIIITAFVIKAIDIKLLIKTMIKMLIPKKYNNKVYYFIDKYQNVIFNVSNVFKIIRG